MLVISVVPVVPIVSTVLIAAKSRSSEWVLGVLLCTIFMLIPTLLLAISENLPD
ncbi:TPA: hypothetical protein SMN35_001477 [Proteus mirabilis]